MTAAGSGNPAEKDLFEVARQTALGMGSSRKIVAKVKDICGK